MAKISRYKLDLTRYDPSQSECRRASIRTLTGLNLLFVSVVVGPFHWVSTSIGYILAWWAASMVALWIYVGGKRQLLLHRRYVALSTRFTFKGNWDGFWSKPSLLNPEPVTLDERDLQVGLRAFAISYRAVNLTGILLMMYVCGVQGFSWPVPSTQQLGVLVFWWAALVQDAPMLLLPWQEVPDSDAGAESI